MPQLKIVQLYQGLQPYFYDVDNLPITDLIENDNRINTACDANSQLISDAIGNAGSLALKLNTCMDSLGNLLQTAVDNAQHHIGEHYEAIVNPLVNDYYVIMMNSERQKLSSVTDNATALTISMWSGAYGGNLVETLYTNEHVEFIPSETINWTTSIQSGHQYVSAQLAFGGAFVQHNYGATPTASDYRDYTVPTGNYVSGTLRVYINGIRLLESPSFANSNLLYVPSYVNAPTSISWVQNSYEEVDPDSGTFTLYNAITVYDTIQVDFDLSLT